MVNISVVIPVYNGAGHLEKFIEKLIPHLEQLNRTWEIFFVDDHSTDDSFNIIKKNHQREQRVGGCRLVKNRGQQNAVYCGLSSCQGDLVITMDDDGQHPMERIPELIRRCEEGWDVVYMVNRDRKRKRVLRFGTGVTDLFFRLFCSKPAKVEIGSFRIIRRSVIDRIMSVKTGYVYISALIFQSRPKPTVCSLRYTKVRNQSSLSRFSLLGRLKIFIRLFLFYGPVKGLMKSQEKAYQVEESL